MKIRALKSSPQMTVPQLPCPDFYAAHWNLLTLELSVSGVHELGPSQTSIVPSLPFLGAGQSSSTAFHQRVPWFCLRGLWVPGHHCSPLTSTKHTVPMTYPTVTQLLRADYVSGAERLIPGFPFVFQATVVTRILRAPWELHETACIDLVIKSMHAPGTAFPCTDFSDLDRVKLEEEEGTNLTHWMGLLLSSRGGHSWMALFERTLHFRGNQNASQ